MHGGMFLIQIRRIVKTHNMIKMLHLHTLLMIAKPNSQKKGR